MKPRAGIVAPPDNQSWEVGGPEAHVLVTLAQDSLRGETNAEAAAEQRFLTAFRRQTGQRTAHQPRAWARVAVYGGALACAAALALLVLRSGVFGHATDALSYRISDGQMHGPSLIEASNAPVNVRFSDGTAVELQRGAQAQVLETTARGARLRLDSGHVSLDVVPHAERGKWSIDAGPFQVRVTGTAFSVEWDDSQRSLEVGVSRGHVIVEGPGIHKELGAGDIFHWQGEALEPHPAASSVPEAAGPEASDSPATMDGAPAPALSGAGHALNTGAAWSQLVADGQFAAVVDAAELRGISSCLTSCRLDDLNALADAARFTGRSPLAEQALSAERARFAGSDDAKAAAFLLGRLAESGHTARSLEWYKTYLAESPAGRFASEALGRSMVLSAANRPAGAVSLAAQYLEHYPSGPYASHARSILEAEKAPN